MKLIEVKKNGTKVYLDDECPRCAGQGGAEAWKFTGWTCYECCGTGKRRNPRIVKETVGMLKRKQERRAEEQAERARILAEQEAEQAARKAEEARIKAISQYVGTVGERLKKIELTLVKEAAFEVQAYCGFGTDTMNVYTMADTEGNKYVWKTTGDLGKWDENGDWIPVQVDHKVILSATIKQHSEYNDEKQTVLTRCKVY